jgi:hypothetical protein
MANQIKTVAQLEEELARTRLALAEAKKADMKKKLKKKKLKESEDEDDEAGHHEDEVDTKKDKKGDKDDEDDEDKEDMKEDAEGELMMKGGAGKEPDVKDEEGDAADAASWAKHRSLDAKKVVGEEKEEDDKEEDDEDGEDDETDKEKSKKDESKARAKHLKVLMQSYMEDEQPAVEGGVDPLLGAKRPDAGASKAVAEGVIAAFDGENLSEGFKTKVSTLVEATINSGIKTGVKSASKIIEAAAQSALTTMVEEIETDINAKNDDFMAYVVSEWLEENKLEASNALKLEVCEGLFEGLRSLFLEHNITMPEGKMDILEAKVEELEEMTGTLNTVTANLIKAEKIILEMKKQEIVGQLSEGLPATQVEKMKTLCEGVEAKDVVSFKEKATIIREAHFKDSKIPAKKDGTGAELKSEAAVDKSVQRYLDAAKSLD